MTVHHVLTDAEAQKLAADLRERGIPVTFETVTLIHPGRPLATEEEVQVLRATARLTDQYRYAPTGAARSPKCPPRCQFCAPEIPRSFL